MCLSVRLHDWIYRNRNVVGRHTTQVFHTCETRTSYDKSTNRATEKNTIFQNVYSIKAAWRLVFGETPISQLIQANTNSKGSFTFLRTERGAASLLFVFNLSINMWISIICSINKGIYTFNSHIFFGESTATTNNNKTIRTAIKLTKKIIRSFMGIQIRSDTNGIVGRECLVFEFYSVSVETKPLEYPKCQVDDNCSACLITDLLPIKIYMDMWISANTRYICWVSATLIRFLTTQANSIKVRKKCTHTLIQCDDIGANCFAVPRILCTEDFYIAGVRTLQILSRWLSAHGTAG